MLRPLQDGDGRDVQDQHFKDQQWDIWLYWALIQYKDVVLPV